MARSGWLGTACWGSSIGALVGLFIIFVAFLNAMTGATAPESRERIAQQRSEASFQNMTRDEWVYKQKDPDHILGRIAVSQARSGDISSATKNVEQIQKLDKNIVRNVAVHEMLHRVVQYGKVEQPEKNLRPVLEKAKEIAKAIDDPLLKADALRRIADVQEQYMDDPQAKEGAKALYAEAAKAVLNRPPTEPPPTYYFNPWLIAWPVGLAIFAGALFCLVRPLLGGLGAATSQATKASEDEEGEEEEEKEEEEEEAKVKPAEAPPAETPVPAAETPAPPQEDALAELGSEAPLAATEPASPPAAGTAETTEEAAVSLAPAPLPTASAPGSKLMAAAVQQAAGGPAGGSPDKKTMMAKPAAATMLAKGAAKTQLARTGQVTKLADSPEALPLPEERKTPPKG